MLEGIIKGLVQWIYSLFIDLLTYVANALLGVLNTDLTFFEQSVPIVLDLYSVFVAVGWGLLIGNCVFQCMKSMFSGLGFEGESPVILLCRTGIFGFLLIFSKEICTIGLGIGKSVIDLIGIPTHVAVTMPDESFFAVGAAWVLVIIIGFILGLQLIKLFLEIGERYAIVAVLTLLAPLGLAMGGSKSTKEICAGYIRCFASMILMLVLNVLFLQLILSGLATMPSGDLVLPWCVLLVGLVRVARKVDNTISKIGLNQAITGDPLGRGTGGMLVMTAARTVLSSVIHKASGSKSPSRPSSGGRPAVAGYHSANNYTGGANTQHYAGDSSTSFGNQSSSYTGGNSQTHSNQSSAQNQTSAQNNQNTRFGAANTTTNTNTRQSSQNGSQSFGHSNAQSKSNVHFAGGTTVNANRFGTVPPSRSGNNAFHSPGPGPQNTGNMSPSPAPAAAPAAESGSHSPGNDSTRAAGTSPAQPNVRAFPGSRNPTSSGQPAFRRTQENSRPSAPASSRPSTYPGAGTSGASRPINRSFTPNGFHSARPIPQGQKPEPKGVPEQPQKQEEGSNE